MSIGNRVLLANRGERGKRKIADRWDFTPFDVVSVRSAINVYRIKDAVTGKEKVVHRNLLLPVDFLMNADQEEDRASLGDSQSSASCVNVRSSVTLDNPEDSHMHTMDWLMRSPDQVEAESGSFLDGDVVGEASPVNANEIQPDELLDSVSEDSAPDHDSEGTDALHNTSQNTDALLHDTLQEHEIAHLPVDQCVALPGPSDLVEGRSEQVSCIRPQNSQAPSVHTRCGRSIRNPRRLICEMSGQKLLGLAGPLIGSVFGFSLSGNNGNVQTV